MKHQQKNNADFLDTGTCSMKKFTILVLALVIHFSLYARKSPNFVLVYMDDLGWAETSVEMIKGRADTRSDFNQTPNLARLAREGMVLSACYSPSALCAPSRNSLLHGMTPSRLRYTVLSAIEARKQYLGQITIPQALKKRTRITRLLILASGTMRVLSRLKPVMMLRMDPTGTDPAILEMMARLIFLKMIPSESFRSLKKASHS